MVRVTPYRDEMLRVAALLKLPPDADPAAIADAVAVALSTPVTVQAEPTGLREALTTAARWLDTITNELARRRQRAGSSQAFADMTDVCNMASEAAGDAHRALSA